MQIIQYSKLINPVNYISFNHKYDFNIDNLDQLKLGKKNAQELSNLFNSYLLSKDYLLLNDVDKIKNLSKFAASKQKNCYIGNSSELNLIENHNFKNNNDKYQDLIDGKSRKVEVKTYGLNFLKQNNFFKNLKENLEDYNDYDLIALFLHNYPENKNIKFLGLYDLTNINNIKNYFFEEEFQINILGQYVLLYDADDVSEIVTACHGKLKYINANHLTLEGIDENGIKTEKLFWNIKLEEAIIKHLSKTNVNSYEDFIQGLNNYGIFLLPD